MVQFLPIETMSCKFFSLILRHSSVLLINHCTRAIYPGPGRVAIKQHELHFHKRLSTAATHQSDEDPDEFEYEDIYTKPENIAGDDPEKLSRVREILREIDLLRQSDNVLFPKKLTTEHWKILLTIETQASRRKYYRTLYLREKTKESKKLRKSRKQYPGQHTLSEGEGGTKETLYGYYRTPVRYSPSQFKRISKCKVAQAMMFGPHLILDCSGDYESHMTDYEVKMTARQIVAARVRNLQSLAPFDIVHCNLNSDGRLMKALLGWAPGLHKPEALFNFSEKNYLELFPADQLVYLSPHSDNELDSYDPRCTYIVGALVDLIVNDPISMRRAQRDGLRTAKFPIDGRVNWCRGTKLLALDRVIEIIRDKRNGSSWEYAFRNIAPLKMTFNFMHRNTEAFNDPCLMSDKYIKAMYFQNLYVPQNDSEPEAADSGTTDTLSADRTEPVHVNSNK